MKTINCKKSYTKNLVLFLWEKNEIQKQNKKTKITKNQKKSSRNLFMNFSQ